MLEQKFEIVYTKFKLHFYQEIFERFQNREASLTTVETFAMETIQALGCPTINEFASFMRISPPNAAYKINSLIRKGYVQKIQSAHDKREYHLQVTQKYKDYYNISNDYVHAVTERIRQRFSPEECAKLEEMLTIINQELMPEVDLGHSQTLFSAQSSPLSSPPPGPRLRRPGIRRPRARWPAGTPPSAPAPLPPRPGSPPGCGAPSAAPTPAPQPAGPPPPPPTAGGPAPWARRTRCSR